MERKQSSVPPPSDYELILIDAESVKTDPPGLVLYGHQFLERLVKTGTKQTVAKMEIPAEAYLALLQVRFSHIPEVQRYLTAVEKTDLINPDGKSQLLKAVSDAIELKPEDFDFMKYADDDDDYEPQQIILATRTICRWLLSSASYSSRNGSSTPPSRILLAFFNSARID
jgi:hypothetical protein